ncbi:MAG TPA: hypothetical protein VGS07_15380 [Thermoanaerobaculia bacterium]|nr:hypothetical protein [Thermoanaerobaculia bacterium]
MDDAVIDGHNAVIDTHNVANDEEIAAIGGTDEAKDGPNTAKHQYHAAIKKVCAAR